MYRYCLFITVFFLSLSAQFGFARQSLKDYGGYKDPALFTRMPHYYLPNSGSVEELQYQAYEFYVTSGNRSEKKRIEGRFSRHTYEYDEKAAGARPSSLQIIRNYQAAAKQIGGQILFDDGCLRRKEKRPGSRCFPETRATFTTSGWSKERA